MQICCLIFRFIFFYNSNNAPSCAHHFFTSIYTIHRTTFVLIMNNAENIPLSKNIAVVCVPFTHISPTSIQRYRQLTDRGLPLYSNNTSHISYTIQCRELVPSSFDSFSTNLHEYIPYRSVRWCCVTIHARVKIYKSNPGF